MHGHSFDVAREGYVDLLPAGHGRSRRTGDSVEMVRARARILDRGFFDPLADAIETMVAAFLDREHARTQDRGSPVILDSGCGTGHLLERLLRRIETTVHGRGACFIGADLSKAAVRIAARRVRDAIIVVNDVHHRLCVADASVDVLLDVFAPRNAAEFARVTRPGGMLLVAVPHRDHMRELGAALPLLRIDRDKPRRVAESLAGAFRLAGRRTVRVAEAMTAEEIVDLLRMTPHQWHLDAADWERAQRLGSMRVTFGFVVLRFIRTP